MAHVDGTSALLSEHTADFYRAGMRALDAGNVQFLVGGAYALAQYTPVVRHTKDFDIFVRRTDAERALEVLGNAGYRTELTYPHWLGKAFQGPDFIDVIFSSGNGVAVVDDEWFSHATRGEVLGQKVLFSPPEEMIWSKGFLLERERYDGADVAHLLAARAGQLDWDRLVRRFGEHWRVLYAHLVLFGYVYPGHRLMIPPATMRGLTAKLLAELQSAGVEGLCQGTLISREQFLVDVEKLGYRDARLEDPAVQMSEDDVTHWTKSIPGRAEG